ncbi:SAM-dependent DNA methyltransferase [Dietzia sp. SLG510A3-3B2-2]|nr:SAM-dependent DNA methyltransferase [Dietzia sp. SLG510A3-40A3]MBB1008390.1 SAM-dependent DNA methyltransferase [Dietzia sp. SLG510A3-3B2-2]
MRKRTHKSADVHSDWLSQVDIDGPFLAHPVLKDMWPSGVDRLGDTDDRLITFKQAYAQWQRAFDQYDQQPRTSESKEAYDSVRRAWIDVVLNDLAEWNDLLSVSDVTVRSPGEQITVAATSALKGREDETAALLLVCEPTSGLRDAGLDGWAANEIDRLAMLLRKAQVEVGIVTDGQWWALVWAEEGKPTGSGVVNALTWAEEPLLRDAFLTLINQRRFRASDAEQRLTRLFERSELEAEEITEALGTQVRRSVELLIQAFSEARLHATKAGDPDPLTENPDDIYQAAVTVMMRVVFLLFAEQRDMLPTEQLYWDSYAINGLVDDLRAQAAGGEELLDESYDAWHRLLAVSQALHSGVNYDEMRMPAYGGSLLDPERFPWLHAADSRGLRLRVSDRVMLHVLESAQSVVVKGERRRISFREIDVEQIGYIYEGLLGYSCAEVSDDIVLGLVGKDGAEPEIALTTINDLYDEHGGDSKKFARAIVAWFKENQPAATGKTVSALTKLVDREPAGDDRAELVRMLSPVAAGDRSLLETLVRWGNLIRRDLRNIPLVIPVGGLVVIETPSRKNAGAHYTPKSLAEEVVLHALQPLVYEPGPLQTHDDSEWKLKSAAAILDLKVADVAAGSGAFLVAAARFLSERLVEAWIDEGIVSDPGSVGAEEIRRRALREVIARCLYGADINPTAVEMCKLSLWLVSMDKTKPFSFVDDKLFCGNSLLGLTSIEQLRCLHLFPNPSTMQQQLLVDIDSKIAAATQLRQGLASPVEERDPMRSSRAKTRLLEKFQQATAELRLVADSIIAAALPHGGKPGRQLDDAFKTLSWQLQLAFPVDGSLPDQTSLLERISLGLTPTVATDYARWIPIHWILAAPDVMIDNGGFDAIVGNPPFLVSKNISGALGGNMREAMVSTIAEGNRGAADLVVYFLLRAAALLRSDGYLGLICAKSVAEGDSRDVGLARLLANGFSVGRSVRSERWPSALVATHYSVVWGGWRTAACPVSDGRPVREITAELRPASRVRGKPGRLLANKTLSYKGSVLLGKGFMVEEAEVESWVASHPENAEVLRPYLNGADLNSSPSATPTKWVIDFGERSLEHARSYHEPFARVLETVKPERDKNPIKARREQWWLHVGRAPELYDRIQDEHRVIAMSVVSKFAVPRFVKTGPLLSSALVVFTETSPAFYSVIASSLHHAWTLEWGSRMKTDIRYTPSDVAETFPLPELGVDLEIVGSRLDEAMHAAHVETKMGLTGLLNQFHNPTASSSRIDFLRAAWREVDRSVLTAYGWDDLSPSYGFRESSEGMRWKWDEETSREALDRLLELNYQRARAEGQDVSTSRPSDEQETLSA